MTFSHIGVTAGIAVLVTLNWGSATLAAQSERTRPPAQLSLSEESLTPKTTIEQALKAALEKVPGQVHEIDLLEKPGDLDWVVELLTPDGRRIRVEVDGESGIVTRIAESKPEHLAGDPERGKAMYEKHCLACHGEKGKGDGPFGRHLFPPAADYGSPEVKTKSDMELFKAIRDGVPGTAMQSFRRRLSNQQIRDVLAYVRSLSK
ncbi:MAG: hypothetical protein KatS3mg082_2123 [Nitrospiraceae bacterium]|nr:MAG: hypothetical protein KatS3mg082_2123 [Nitrospiraceae bacterium]